ncbi:MAG: MFS transporter, partial [Gammaproteobacteria bacterium]
VVGHGAGFGLHEFLDQLGAIVGPLIVAALVVAAGYRAGFAILAIPAVLALVALAFARRFEVKPAKAVTASGKWPRAFWLWVVFAALATGGFAHFALVAFDLAKIGFTPALIPVLFAVAMAAEGLAGLIFGRLSDRLGAVLLAGFPICGLIGTVLLFLAPGWARWVGAVVWGVGLGLQAAVVRAEVARVVAEGRRGEAFGILDTAMGAAWFVGSVVLGALYELTPAALAIAAVVIECAALAWLLLQWPRLHRPV